MKKGCVLMMFFVTIFITLEIVSAQSCDLSATLINQDPFPATPGKHMEIVFQIGGVSDPGCGVVEVKLVEKFPFTLDPGENARKTITSGITTPGSGSNYWLVKYKLVVHEDALENGANKIELRFGNSVLGKATSLVKEFELEVEDVKTDFEVSIKDYDYNSNQITLEILNIGESDADALTVEIPKQDGIKVKGSNRNIVGSLDSNEDTTFSYEGIPKDGVILIEILYTDKVGERHKLEKSIEFDSSYFVNRKKDEVTSRTSLYISFVIILILIGIWIWRKNIKKKERLARIHHHSHHKIHHKS